MNAQYPDHPEPDPREQPDDNNGYGWPGDGVTGRTGDPDDHDAPFVPEWRRRALADAARRGYVATRDLTGR